MGLLGRILVVVAAVGWLSSLPVLSQEGFPMKQSAVWKGHLAAGGAEADCSLQTEDSINCRLLVQAHGLKPNGLYSFWLRDADDKEKGLGKEPYSAQADKRGKLTYRPQLNFCPNTKNVKITIKYNPSSGPAVRVLNGVLSRD